MRKFIVSTTTHPQSIGVTRFAEFPDWHLILVDDLVLRFVKTTIKRIIRGRS